MLSETFSPKILDCTFRDGGYTCNWNYPDEQFEDLYKSCEDSGIDYCEIGFKRKFSENTKFGKWYYCQEEMLNNVVKPIKNKCKIAVMSQLGTFSTNDFVAKKDSCIDMVRVLMAYHTGNKDDNFFDRELFEQGLEIIERLVDLGYEVTFNIGRIDKIPKKILEEICFNLNKTRISAFYIADTYGNLTFNSSSKILKFIRSHLKKKIDIGYHAHDNLGNATAKTIQVCHLLSSQGRPKMIDGTMFGLGRGSGNAKTELLLAEFKRNYIGCYNYINKWISSYKETIFGYNLLYIISGIHSMHVNYPLEIIEKHQINIDDAVKILFDIIEKEKHHFYDDKIISTLL